MKRTLYFLFTITLFSACSNNDDDNDILIESSMPVYKDIQTKDIADIFTLYKTVTNDTEGYPEGVYKSLTIEKNGYGKYSDPKSPIRNFSWSLQNGIILFYVNNNINSKGYFSKDKWGLQLIIKDGEEKRFYRNYDITNSVTSIKLKNPPEDIFINQSYEIGVSYTPSDLTYVNPTWTVSDSTFAKITNGKLQTSIKSGRVKIIAQAGSLKDSIYIDIKEPKGYKFGYKFGSSITDVNPDVWKSDFAYNTSIKVGESLKAFKFSNNKLVSIWSCHATYSSDLFYKELKTLNAPADFMTTINLSKIEFKDPTSWDYQDFKILVRKGLIPINRSEFPMNIIEYSQNK